METNKIPPDYYDQSLRKNLLQRLFHQARLNLVNKFLGQVNGDLLDVGCSSGIFSQQMVEKVSGKVFGVDIDPEFITYGQKKRPEIKLLVASADSLPFSGSKFTALTCLHVLEHLAKPQEALLEFNRVLEKGGKLIISIPSESFLFRFLWFFWLRGKGKVWKNTHLWKFKEDQVKKMIEKSGFRLIGGGIYILRLQFIFAAEKI